jgi:hypothetical protein
MDIAAALDAAGVTEPVPDAPADAGGDEAANDNAGALEQALESVAAETEATEAEPANDTAAAEVDPFAPEQLATPAGIEKARSVIAEERQKQFRKARELDGRDIRLKEKARKLDHRVEETNRKTAQERAFVQDVYNTVNLVRTGNASQRIEALGRLTGLPGQKAYEELSFGIIHDGKKQQPSPEVAALQGEIGELKTYIQQVLLQQHSREQGAEKQRKEQFIEEQLSGLIEQAQSAETYPNLARFLGTGKEREVREYLREVKVEHHKQTGMVLDDGAALSRIESEIAHALGDRAAKPTSLGTPPKPSGNQAQRPPGHKVIPPSLAARSGGAVRELTDDERLDELSRDPEFLRIFGG